MLQLWRCGVARCVSYVSLACSSALVCVRTSFADIHDDMDLAEDFIKSVVRHVLATCADEIAFFNERVDPDKVGAWVRDGLLPVFSRSLLSLMVLVAWVVVSTRWHVVFAVCCVSCRNCWSG